MGDDRTGISPQLQAAYDDFYTDEVTEWRELGARSKAANILRVCEGRSFGKVLDCGAGDGSILSALDQSGAFGQLYAIEISDSGVARIRARKLARLVEAVKFDGYHIPYPDQHFDMAYCSHVIEHVEHPRRLLRELKRVSRFQVFEVPLDYQVDVDRHLEHYLSYGHINIYTPSLFRFLLGSEGFRILADHHSHISQEQLRYNWYRNMKLEKTMLRELQLRMVPLKRWVRQRRLGADRYREFGYSAYTCLAEDAGEAKVFDR